MAVWPGGLHNSQNITQCIAKKARSFVMSVYDPMRRGDIPADFPHLAKILADCTEIPANGGSCLLGPEEEWIIPPVVNREELAVAALENRRVREDRQNFNPSGYYAQPDVTQLTVNRERQLTVIYEE
ncbi:MAG: hypothetical protein HY895_14755 [Deltaproteobacteria bacterium]|nr:hypothetical protein [Deltaproteobacteria bacterium]